MKNLLFILAFLPFVLAAQNPSIAGYNGDLLKVYPDSTKVTGNFVVTGDITGNGDLATDTIEAEFAFIKTKAHGFYAFEDSTVVIDCTQDVWVQITNPAGNIFTEIQTNEGFIISGDTIYFNRYSRTGLHPHVEIRYEIDGTGGNNVSFSFRMKNVTQNFGVVKKSTTKAGANDQLSIQGTAYDRQAAFGDAYIFEIRNNTNSTDFTVTDGGIKLEVSHY